MKGYQKQSPYTRLGQALLGLCLVIFIAWVNSLHIGALRFTAGQGNTSKIPPHERLNAVQAERHRSYLALANLIRPFLQKDDVILVPEVGIISYSLPEYEIRDVSGIASPNVTLETVNNFDYFVDYYQPRFIINPFLRKSPASVIFHFGDRRHVYKPFAVVAPEARFFPTLVYRRIK